MTQYLIPDVGVVNDAGGGAGLLLPSGVVFQETQTGNIAHPSSDITTTGWTANGGPSSLYDCIDETSYSDTDYIQSPSITGAQGPATFGLTPSLSAGNQNVRIRGKYTESAAQVKVTLLDAGDSAVGNTGWQALSGSFSTYTLPLTITGTATKCKVEVQ